MNQVPPVPCSLADMLNDLEWLKVGFAAAKTFATQREALDWARTKGIAITRTNTVNGNTFTMLQKEFATKKAKVDSLCNSLQEELQGYVMVAKGYNAAMLLNSSSRYQGDDEEGAAHVR
jgi:hypothetical protein